MQDNGRPPLSLAWVPRMAESMIPLDLFGWDLLATADPLKWVLHLRFKNKLTDDSFKQVRTYLSAWCNVNDCVYKKSHWKKWDFKAKILIKALGPKQDNHPLS